LDDARKLVQVNMSVPVNNLERILPLKEAKDIVYRTPDHLVLIDCLCRRLKEKPCTPTEVCLLVGEPFASFAKKQQPDLCRDITAAEAVAILEETDRLGWTHITFNRDVLGDTFYAICNCCNCCCKGMIAYQQMDLPVFYNSGYLTEITGECSGCGLCESLCQFNAVAVGRDGVAVIDRAKCMGCGVCVSNCPDEAVSLREAENGLAPLRLR